jgi:excinuclease ABC subunit C
MPAKEYYRYFKLKTLGEQQIDDFESMREIVARRYTRVLNEDLPRPDLILIDGGKGQVNAVHAVLESLGLGDIPLIGLAKANEEIYFPHTSLPLILDRESQALKLLQAVRDESHRFATGFQKKLRQKRLYTSIFENVKGIGKEKSRQLLKTFGSLQAIMAADPAQVAQAIRVSQAKASELLAYLKSHLGTNDTTGQV